MMTVEQQRSAMLKKLLDGKSQREFQKRLMVSGGYLSQMLSGVRPISQRNALKYESILRLVPGTLVKPNSVDFIKSVEDLYLPQTNQPQADKVQPTTEESIKQIESCRLLILQAIIGKDPLNAFCENYDLNASYVSQLIHGPKTIGERLAKRLEKKLNLIPDTLIHPVPVDPDDAEAICELFNDRNQHLSLPARSLLRKLTLLLSEGRLTHAQINLLKLTAGEFAKASMAVDGEAPSEPGSLCLTSR